MPARAARAARRTLPTLSVLLTALAALPHRALAATAGGALPWETPLRTFATSVSGPVAFSISLLGLVAGGAMLIWGGEINEFIRRFIMLILVGALLLFAANLLTTLFGVGAVITAGALP